VERDLEGFCVRTDAGEWRTRNVVIATGHCDLPEVPVIASTLAPDIAQVVPTSYRHPGQLRDGGVLVVGASATGIQLASEIARSGRAVTLAVGRHTRLPRRYRGRDIMEWLDVMGVLTETTGQVWNLAASRAQPSLQLIGSDDHRSLDLDMLRAQGVRLAGRMIGSFGQRAYFAKDLVDSIAHAEVKMHEQLDRVDDYIERMQLGTDFPGDDRPHRVPVPVTPGMIDLAAEGIDTVLWATGYRREYPWLRVPVLDARGEIEHTGGITAEPGLYALGLQFMRRRNSSFLDGVGADAAELADHIVHRMARHRLAVA
jgi:putative flavoprotein involved in K+ transport